MGAYVAGLEVGAQVGAGLARGRFRDDVTAFDVTFLAGGVVLASIVARQRG